MMEEDDEDASAVEDVEQIDIRASVFEAYSRQKSTDKKKRKSTTSTAATMGHLEIALGASPPQNAEVKKKEKFGLKLKKYLASKLSETTTGQGIIQNYISDRGQTVIKALCHCMLKFSGRDIARVMRRYVYKLASKFGILYADKAIKEEKLNAAKEPVLGLALYLMNHLNRCEDDRQDRAHISGLKALITDAYEALRPLCTDLTSESNTQRLRVVYKYLTKGEFLNFFLCSPTTEAERRTISTALGLVVEDTHGDAEGINRSYRKRLFQRKNVLSALLSAPSLHLFLKNSETVVVEEIESKVHAQVFPMNLFWDAFSAVLQSLEGLFIEFLGSQEYSLLQLELRKIEKRLQVLAQLSGVSDESFKR